MSEPRVRYEVTPGKPDQRDQTRAVRLVLRADWAQSVYRLLQLHNEGYMRFQVISDESGRVRIEPDA